MTSLTPPLVLFVVQTILVFNEVHVGLGNEATFDGNGPASDLVMKYYFANTYLYLLVLLASKAAVGLLFLRLTRFRGHILIIRLILCSCAAWFIASVFLVSIGISYTEVFQIPYARWLGIGLTDIMTEVAFVVMAIYLVGNLRMGRVQKITVISAFALRLCIVPPCALRLYYLNPSTLASNRNMAFSLVVVCTQLQLGYGIMASSITTLKPFMAVYEKAPEYTHYVYESRSALDTVNTKRSALQSRQMSCAAPFPEHSHHATSDGGTASPHTVGSITEPVGTPLEEEHGRCATLSVPRLAIERTTSWLVTHEEASPAQRDPIEMGGRG